MEGVEGILSRARLSSMAGEHGTSWWSEEGSPKETSDLSESSVFRGRQIRVRGMGAQGRGTVRAKVHMSV